MASSDDDGADGRSLAGTDGSPPSEENFSSSETTTDGEGQVRHIARKALLIAAHYYGDRHLQLDSPSADATAMETYLRRRGFEHIMLVTDNPRALAREPGLLQPTRENILCALDWLVEGCQRGDSLFLGVSGTSCSHYSANFAT